MTKQMIHWAGQDDAKKVINRYEIEYRRKKYVYTGANCGEAMEKFSHRKVFGEALVFDYKIKMYDADTRGEEWAQYKCNHGEDFASITHIK